MRFFKDKEENLELRVKALDIRCQENTNQCKETASIVMAFEGEKDKMRSDIIDIYKNIGQLFDEIANIKQEVKMEDQSVKVTREILPDTLTCKDVSSGLNGFQYLNQTSFRYYLYENDILDMRINKTKNTYKLSEKFDSSNAEIKKYIHVTDGAITFDKDVLQFLILHAKELQDSIDRYERKQKQIAKSKKKLAQIEYQNYKKEICRICGTGDKYDKDKWANIYSVYGKYNPNYVKHFEIYASKFKEENPNAKYPATKVQYIVNECNDGDVLLKIACELYVE